jgi:predicted phosphodiesterase
MKILSLSDKTISFIYSPQVQNRFQGVDLIIGCGDLSYYYLEYVLNALDVPLFFVRGNHDNEIEYSTSGKQSSPAGGVDLHRRVINHKGLLLAGIEGSLRYKPGPFQYTQAEMWIHVFPLYFYHGHVHVYRPGHITESRLGSTRIINTFGFREGFVNPPIKLNNKIN